MPAISSSDAESKFFFAENIGVTAEKPPAILDKMRSTQSTYYLDAVFSSPESYKPNDTYALKEAMSLSILEGFKYLKDNWNGNGATKFDSAFIEEAQGILLSLDKTPDIFPTGRSSIQFEYEKQNGNYLEFEIFQDGRINCFQIINGEETESVIEKNQMNSFIHAFYAA